MIKTRLCGVHLCFDATEFECSCELQLLKAVWSSFAYVWLGSDFWLNKLEQKKKDVGKSREKVKGWVSNHVSGVCV